MSLTVPPTRPCTIRTTSSTSVNSSSSRSQTSKPPRKNKPRLYIALYSRGDCSSSFKTSSNCDSYHWALVVGPNTCARTDEGTRYHISHNSNPSIPFLYEESDILTSHPASTILVRICIAKILSLPLLITTLRTIPIPPPSTDPTYTCLSWTRAAFTALVTSKSILKSCCSASEWKDIENCGRRYCKRKRDLRRFTDPSGPWNPKYVSTYNFWERREIAP